MVDATKLQLENLVVHEIPRHFAGDQEGGPFLSQIETDLTPLLRNFFRERISSSLGIAAYDVEFDPGSTSPIPELVTARLRDEGSGFLQMSHAMANHLYQSQGGPSPEGLLCVGQGSLGPAGRAVAIMKLEKEEGVRVRHDQKDGKETLSVDHIADLMLTEKTKVFKVGLFVIEDDVAVGSVADNQRGYGTAVAQFFLQRFLGCRLREHPEITTKRFFEETQRFINEDVDDSERKARYQVALAADLGGPTASVAIESFAASHLEVDDRQRFTSRIEDAGITAPSFEKNVSLIAAHLRRIQFTFKGGTAVLAPPDEIGESVKIDSLDNGQTRLEISDVLEETRGRR